jgi:serine/threonine protein phosphatase PrpC
MVASKATREAKRDCVACNELFVWLEWLSKVHSSQDCEPLQEMATFQFFEKLIDPGFLDHVGCSTKAMRGMRAQLFDVLICIQDYLDGFSFAKIQEILDQIESFQLRSMLMWRYLVSFTVASLLLIGSSGSWLAETKTRKACAFLPQKIRFRNSGANRRIQLLFPLRLRNEHEEFSYETSSGKEIQIGVCCRKGSDPKRPQKVNQDAYFHAVFHSDDSESYFCAGVLDGHGLKGHIVSEYFANQLLLQLHINLEITLGKKIHFNGGSNHAPFTAANVSAAEFEKQVLQIGGLEPGELSSERSLIYQAIIKSFHCSHLAAMQDPSIPAGRNGATCVMIFIDFATEKLHVAHVGDSRASSVSLNGEKSQCIPLSVATTVKVEDERKRIETEEGSIRGNNVFYGPVGIAMTRSLGNAVMLRAGVVPTPLFESFPLPQPNERIVIATDGIWDVMTNEAVALVLCANGNNVEVASRMISDEARRKWLGDLPIIDEETIDDITCMVLHMRRRQWAV